MKRSKSRQQIFDLVLDHLRGQGRSSEIVWVDGVTRSLYHDSSGLQSPVGCLISSGLYYPELEGYPPRSPEVVRTINKSLNLRLQPEGNDGQFLAELQFISEAATSAEQLRLMLSRTAKYWTLDGSRIEQIKSWRR